MLEEQIERVKTEVGIFVMGNPQSGSGERKIMIGTVLDAAIRIFVDRLWSGLVADGRESEVGVVRSGVPQMRNNLGGGDMFGVVIFIGGIKLKFVVSDDLYALSVKGAGIGPTAVGTVNGA